MTIDLSSVEQSVGTIIGIALATLLGILIQKISKKMGIQNDAAVTQGLTNAATIGINSAVMGSIDLIKAKGWDHVDVKNALVAGGVNYVAQKFPDLLQKAGIDPTTTAGVTQIKDIVTRAIPDAVTTAAASPATPPAPEPKGAIP